MSELPGTGNRPELIIALEPAEIRKAFRHFRECAIQAAHWRRRCERHEAMCGGPAIWGEAHPLDIDRLRYRELWRCRTARAMRDLLMLLRAPLIGRKGLMRRIREAALAYEPLDLSGFAGDHGNVRFILLGTPERRARWCEVT
jgi:hypothetical protein